MTFRLYAPNAHEVKLQAEGLEATPGATEEQVRKGFIGEAMSKGDDGVWIVDVSGRFGQVFIAIPFRWTA